MRNRLIPGVLSLLCAAGALRAQGNKPPDPDDAWKALARKCRASVLRIHDGNSVGTGFVIHSEKGEVLTNAHVVPTAIQETELGRFENPPRKGKVRLITAGGQQLEGEVLAGGRSASRDIAVIKIIGNHGLPALPIDERDQPEHQESVLACGYPGDELSTTRGTISAVNIRKQDHYHTFQQTDASIHKGNSGGPLLGRTGKVIGMNTRIQDAPGGGMGFAISAPDLLRFTTQYRRQGNFDPAGLGVGLEAAAGTGVVVRLVLKDSPAEKGGLLAGDVILKFKGIALPTDPYEARRGLIRLIRGLAPSERVNIRVKRGDKESDVPVTMGKEEAPPDIEFSVLPGGPRRG